MDESDYHEQVKRAAGSDISDWGSKKVTGAYRRGTKFVINGVEFDPEHVDEILARKLAPPAD